MVAKSSLGNSWRFGDGARGGKSLRREESRDVMPLSSPSRIALSSRGTDTWSVEISYTCRRIPNPGGWSQIASVRLIYPWHLEHWSGSIQVPGIPECEVIWKPWELSREPLVPWKQCPRTPCTWGTSEYTCNSVLGTNSPDICSFQASPLRLPYCCSCYHEGGRTDCGDREYQGKLIALNPPDHRTKISTHRVWFCLLPLPTGAPNATPQLLVLEGQEIPRTMF